MASNFQSWFLKHSISIISLHNPTCQIEASGAVAWDCEDEGLWRFPGAGGAILGEVFGDLYFLGVTTGGGIP